MVDTRSERESEVRLELPTSGQLLGALARNLGIDDHRLRSKSARRYYSGRLEERVKESSRQQVIEAIAAALTDLGLGPSQPWVDDVIPQPPTLAEILGWHALNWDRLRAFLLPRMARIYPHDMHVVWRAYARFAMIDLALRLAAYLRITGSPLAALEFLDWISPDRRGRYLNRMRNSAGFSVSAFSEAADVSTGSVEAWLYRNVRPTDESLTKIASALASKLEPSQWTQLHAELKRLYWTSDVAALLENYVGTEAMMDIVRRLRQYASQLHHILDEGVVGNERRHDLVELATLGAQSRQSEPLLAALEVLESDDEWKEDLSATGSDWIGRVLRVTLDVDRKEVEDLIDETDGQILKRWNIQNLRAYDHYRHSLELQALGRFRDALTKVAKAAELDPMDPVYHYSLGSAKGYRGAGNGDLALVEEGLQSCWLAVSLDPNWISPWTEIGWLLLRTGRAPEAVEHLKGVRPGCGPLDARYYHALGTALSLVENHSGALEAFEYAFELNPDDPRIAVEVATTALKLGDRFKFNDFRKSARHLGVSEKWESLLELTEALEQHPPRVSLTKLQEIAALDAIIARNLDDDSGYFRRALFHFENEDDVKAITDLDAAIRINPVNPDFRLFRGIVHAYMKRFDLVIEDMTKVISLRPDDITALYHRGAALGEQDAFDLAISDFNEILRIKPDHVDALRGRGDCHRYKSEYDQAIDDYAAALKIDSKDFLLYRSRGAAHRMKVDFDQAIDDYDTALKIAPEDSLSYRFRGDAYLGLGGYERAIADFDAALELSGADEVAYRSRGKARLLIGEVDLAIVDFDAAIECDSESAEAIFCRGIALQIIGDEEGANRDYSRARELGYDDPEG